MDWKTVGVIVSLAFTGLTTLAALVALFLTRAQLRASRAQIQQVSDQNTILRQEIEDRRLDQKVMALFGQQIKEMADLKSQAETAVQDAEASSASVQQLAAEAQQQISELQGVSQSAAALYEEVVNEIGRQQETIGQRVEAMTARLDKQIQRSLTAAGDAEVRTAQLDEALQRGAEILNRIEALSGEAEASVSEIDGARNALEAYWAQFVLTAEEQRLYDEVRYLWNKLDGGTDTPLYAFSPAGGLAIGLDLGLGDGSSIYVLSDRYMSGELYPMIKQRLVRLVAKGGNLRQLIVVRTEAAPEVLDEGLRGGIDIVVTHSLDDIESALTSALDDADDAEYPFGAGIQ